MRHRIHSAAGLLACCAAIGSMTLAFAADPPASPGSKVLVAKTFRTSKLIGMNVRNAEGEKLGVIEDFVVSLEGGKIAYAALGVGGVLGVGEKLFAVPFTQLKFNHGKDEMFFVLNMPKEKLKSAPGFDKRDWPNVADPKWAEEIDLYYHQAKVEEAAATRK